MISKAVYDVIVNTRLLKKPFLISVLVDHYEIL